MTRLTAEATLHGVVKALVGRQPVSAAERRILDAGTASVDPSLVAQLTQAIRDGQDPLGAAYCTVHRPEQRRDRGQTFTPDHVVAGMLGWAKRQRKPIVRIVDPGAGSGRYLLAGLRAFPQATGVAVEMDPTVALILRANLAAAGLSERAQVVVGDYRDLKLPRIDGVTLFNGNPPYVRHHGIEAKWKAWYADRLAAVGHDGSGLAGLHLHFFLKTLELAQEGDLGCYVTAAEWLDVNYGRALRQLLTNGLGGKDVFVVDPEVQVFDDAMVSAAITCFSPGSNRKELRFKAIHTESDLRKLPSGQRVSVSVAKSEPKWSVLVRGARTERPSGYIELGELFQVSRGQVTGLNRVWVEGDDTPSVPAQFLLPSITDSADITKAPKHVISGVEGLRRVVSLPQDLSELDDAAKRKVERFLTWAKAQGAHETYIALHRKPWWSVKLREPAPIVMTYMGRRPPAFALNSAGARLINVAHGLYPRQHVGAAQLQKLVGWLNKNVAQEGGRVYAGGLTKFEPSEAMRILVPETMAA
jgi:adenine-specific DNA-methyltransferase